MKYLAISSHFERQLKRLSRQDQEKATEALKKLLLGLKETTMPVGLGFKKINGDKFEVRIDIRKRIVMKLDGETLVCHVIGDHETVKRYLRNYRNK